MSEKTLIDSRDDFSPATKDILAKRAGFICSYPGCGRMTIGPSEDRTSRVTMVGVAAHITAASRRGPRFNVDLKPDERGSERNGVWLCQLHGKAVDDNESVFTVQELERWKAQHEAWVLQRVLAGEHTNHHGLTSIRLSAVGRFQDTVKAALGRHNIVVGDHDTGAYTFCKAVAALAGGPDYVRFFRGPKEDCFTFPRFPSLVPDRSAIEAEIIASGLLYKVRLSLHCVEPRNQKQKSYFRVQKEIGNNVSIEWPRHLLTTVLFSGQLYQTRGGLKDTFRAGIRYIASAFSIIEEDVWDSFREDLYLNSPLGYRFRRSGRYRVQIRVPDGRSFFLSHENLSFSEQQFALVDIALSFMRSASPSRPYMLILDPQFFGRLSGGLKTRVFEALRSGEVKNVQSILCVTTENDADLLRERTPETWIGASPLGDITVHSFL